MLKIIDGKKYYPVSERIEFGLESMYEHARYMVECEREKLSEKEIDYWWDIADECSRLMHRGWLCGKDYGKAKELTFNREMIRYHRCLDAGMSEAEASKCFG